MSYQLIIITIITIWGLGVVIPGPNFILTVQTAMNASRKSALFVVSGLVTGTVFWGISGFLGISILFKTAPWLFKAMRLIGGCYLIYLGVQLLLGKKSGGDPIEITAPCSSRWFLDWRSGLFTNLANPKTAMFVSSLFATTLPANPSWLLGVFIVSLMALISTVWYSSVAFLLSSNGMIRRYKQVGKWIDRSAACLFLGFGIKLIKGEN